MAAGRALLLRRLLPADAVQPGERRLDGLAVRPPGPARGWSRRSGGRSIYESARFKLRGLDPEARYSVSDVEDTGKELMETGLLLTLANQPDSAMVVYKRKEIRR